MLEVGGDKGYKGGRWEKLLTRPFVEICKLFVCVALNPLFVALFVPRPGFMSEFKGREGGSDSASAKGTSKKAA